MHKRFCKLDTTAEEDKNIRLSAQLIKDIPELKVCIAYKMLQNGYCMSCCIYILVYTCNIHTLNIVLMSTIKYIYTPVYMLCI